MINATQFSAIKLAILDIAIKVGVFAALLVLDIASKALANFDLPAPAITLPLATLLISQLDAYFVDYAKKENVPLPQ